MLELYALLHLTWVQRGWVRCAQKPQIERKENGELECRSFWTQKWVWEKATPEYFILLADTPLWEKALFINRIFSKPRCHTEKHTLNKMPFLTSLLFPRLPFGRRKGSVYNMEYFCWELQMSPCLSRNGEMPFRGMWQVTKRVILKSWRFFSNCHSLPENILYAERLQHKCSCYRGHAHIAVGIFEHRIHTCRSEKDLILAEMNLVYAMLDWQFSRCFWKTFPALKIILSS